MFRTAASRICHLIIPEYPCHDANGKGRRQVIQERGTSRASIEACPITHTFNPQRSKYILAFNFPGFHVLKFHLPILLMRLRESSSSPYYILSVRRVSFFTISTSRASGYHDGRKKDTIAVRNALIDDPTESPRRCPLL